MMTYVVFITTAAFYKINWTWAEVSVKNKLSHKLLRIINVGGQWIIVDEYKNSLQKYNSFSILYTVR